MQKKGKKEEGRTQFVINYHTPSHEPNNPMYFLPLFLLEKIMI